MNHQQLTYEERAARRAETRAIIDAKAKEILQRFRDKALTIAADTRRQRRISEAEFLLLNLKLPNGRLKIIDGKLPADVIRQI